MQKNENNDEPLKRYSNIEDLRDHRFFRHVVEVLRNHPYKDDLIALHAAVLVDGSRILSIGHNKPWRPRFVRMIKNAHENLSTHAETDAINACRKRDLMGTKLYVARVLKDGETVAISRPCQYCQSAMDAVGIKHAIYTTYYGHLQSMKIVPPYIKLSAGI